MSNNNSNTSTSSGFRTVLGFLIIVTLCTNLYIILFFHRSSAGQNLLPPSGDYEGANNAPFALEGRSPRSLLRQQRGGTNWIRKTKQQFGVQLGDGNGMRERRGGVGKRNKKRTDSFAPRWKRSRKKDQQEQYGEMGIMPKDENDDQEQISNSIFPELNEIGSRGDNQQQYNDYRDLEDMWAERHQLQKRLKKLNNKWNNKVWPKPDNWKTMSFYEIRFHFDCSEYANDQTKPLPTVADWNFFKTRYKTMVDRNIVFDDPVPGTDGYTLKEEGGPPPYYATHSTEGRGRGLFASRDIKRGELVHDGEQSDITFPSGMAWRRYVFSLPRNKACDVVDWTWTQQTPTSNGKYVIFCAMNISVLMNGAEDDTEINVNAKESTSSKMYATRDIAKDEEFVTDYTMYDTVWEEVGLCDEECVKANAVEKF